MILEPYERGTSNSDAPDARMVVKEIDIKSRASSRVVARCARCATVSRSVEKALLDANGESARRSGNGQ